MDKKNGPAGNDAAPPTSKEVTKSIRHRFAEGETSVMPLADVLRSRDRGPLLTQEPSAQHPNSDKTSIVATPEGLGPRRSAVSPHQQKTQVVALTAAQTALLSRTEPVPTQVAPERTAPQAKIPAPAERKEPTGRTTLAAISRTPDPATAATQPSLKPAKPSPLDELVNSGVHEAVGDDLEARPKTKLTQPALAAAPQAVALKNPARQRVANGCIVVFSCKGGSGATMLSLNTAFFGAKQGHTACIVDLDLQMGDALAALGLSPRYNIAQASSALADHVPLTKKLLPTHDSGVAVLSQVGTLDDMDKITPESMAALVLAVRQTFDVAIIDGVRDFSDNVLAVLDVAEKISIVTVQEVLAVRRARWAFSILRRIGFDPQDITIVLNRYSPQGDISLASIQTMFDPALVITVPQDTSSVTQSLNRGVPLLDGRGQTSVFQAVGQVCANAIYDDVPVDQGTSEGAPASKPLWQRIFKRSGDAP